MPYTSGLVDLSTLSGRPYRLSCPGAVHLTLQVLDADVSAAFGRGFPPEVAMLDAPEFYAASTTRYELARRTDALEVRVVQPAPAAPWRVAITALTEDDVPGAGGSGGSAIAPAPAPSGGGSGGGD